MARSRDASWTLVRAERAALVRDLEGLEPERWTTPSLCPGWDVHDVLAHLVDSARTTRLGFVRRLAAARFDFDRDNSAGVARERRTDPAETLRAMRDVVDLRHTPPAPLATRAVEAVVHGEDIRRPLGVVASYDSAAVLGALAFQVRTAVGMGGGRERAAGLTLVVEEGPSLVEEGPRGGISPLRGGVALSGGGPLRGPDTEPISFGHGAPVSGRAIDLLLAISGRAVPGAALRGAGADALRARAGAGAVSESDSSDS